MSYRLEFEVLGLPRMANSSGKSAHWRALHKEAMKWQRLVELTVFGKAPVFPLTRYTLRLTRFSSIEPDYDGLVRGFKSIVDGLIRARVIANDTLTNSGAWICEWSKVKQDQGKIRVIVEERPWITTKLN